MSLSEIFDSGNSAHSWANLRINNLACDGNLTVAGSQTIVGPTVYTGDVTITPPAKLITNEIQNPIPNSSLVILPNGLTDIFDIQTALTRSNNLLVNTIDTKTPAAVLQLGGANASLIQANDEINVLDIFQCDQQTLDTVSALRFQEGTSDPFGRRQLLYDASNSSDPSNTGGLYTGNGGVYRMGSLTADGDAQNIISEGIVVYGQHGDPGVGIMDGSNWGLGRMKANRFALTETIAGVQNEFYKVNPSVLQWRESGSLVDAINCSATSINMNKQVNISSGNLLQGDSAHFNGQVTVGGNLIAPNIISPPATNQNITLTPDGTGIVLMQNSGQTYGDFTVNQTLHLNGNVVPVNDNSIDIGNSSFAVKDEYLYNLFLKSNLTMTRAPLSIQTVSLTNALVSNGIAGCY